MSDNPLISVSELTDLLSRRSAAPSRPVLLDVRWTLAGSDRAAYLQAHLPGARFVDLDRELAGAPGDGGRHPLPDPAALQRVWRAAGIDAGTTVVAYDGGIGMAAARAWWLLRWSGVTDVRVLDGGLPAWTGRGLATATGESQRPAADGTVTVVPGSMPVVGIDEAADLAASPDGLLVDARAAARFRGETEPIDPVAGHIPGAVNLPITELLSPDGTFRPRDELAAAFRGLGVGGVADADRGDRTVAASCGSGITACQLILAGEIAGLELALFPGSYSQWCALGRPVASAARVPGRQAN